MTGLTVRMEIAGPTGSSALVARDAAVTRRGQRLATARAVFPLDALRPGAYVARATVSTSSGGRPVRVERPFVFTAP